MRQREGLLFAKKYHQNVAMTKGPTTQKSVNLSITNNMSQKIYINIYIFGLEFRASGLEDDIYRSPQYKNIKSLHHQVAKIYGLENLSL